MQYQLLLYLCVSAAVAEAILGPMTDEGSIAAKFAARNKYFGNIADGGTLNNPKTKQVLSSHFNALTAENSMKWESLERTPGQLTTAGAMPMFNFARQNNMTVRGHTLVWHSQLPQHVRNAKSKAELTEKIQGHIKRTMGPGSPFHGTVKYWDVVNEMFDGNGGFRSKGDGPIAGVGGSIFQAMLGGDAFVKIAFEAARAADPAAKLCINDFNLDSLTNYCKPKIEGLMRNVAKWRAAGVPIDCIGSQSHLKAGEGPAAAIAFKKVCTGAPICAITELDIQGGAPPNDYAAIVKACYDTENCAGVTIWGVLDGQSWRKGSQGLLFDDDGGAKAAYTAIANALK